MVQTKDQYILVHRAVRELFEEQLKIIDSHPYANVDINGLPIDLKADLEEPVYEQVQFVPSPPKLCEELMQTKSKTPSPKTVKPPPSPPNILSSSVHEKYVDIPDKFLEDEKIIKLNGSSGSSSCSSSKNVNKIVSTPSPSAVSQEEAISIESRNLSDAEGVIKVSKGESSSNSKHGSGSSSKSSLLRNPSIVKLKAFFEKSKDDKDKKIFPGLSRAKSDVSSSSRFYSSFTSKFTSPGNRNQGIEVKPTVTTPPKSVVRERTPVEKVKSKPAILTKPNISVKRSKSLKITRPVDDPRENVNLISSVSISSDVPDGPSKPARLSNSSHIHSPESNPIKVNVQHVEIPKLHKPVSKSVKAESFKATTTSQDRDKKVVPEMKDNFIRRKTSIENDYQRILPPQKPDIPSKPHLIDNKVFTPSSTDIYGTTRIKIGISMDDSNHESGKGSHSRLNGKIKKYGTVNSKMITSAGGGTLLTRSQSHVWQPSKPQVPVRIFSDDNLSQIGTTDNDSPPVITKEQSNHSFDEPEGVRLLRKQSLPITKLFSPKVKPVAVPTYENTELKTREDQQQPRSLTLTSHSSFLEARKRVPKTNPYANYSPSSNDSRNFKDTSHMAPLGKLSQELGNSSPITQFHFGESIPLLKNGNGNSSLLRNSSESSSNSGTPRNSSPGTPTQSTDVLYSPLSLNTTGNYSSGRNQSKSTLKGSLSSTPSESDERLDLGSRNPFPSSSQSQVTTNITGPQKISSVRSALGIRERRNSFRQAVWKEDHRGPKDDDKSENIYITTTSSVPYFVKSSAMPLHHNAPIQNPVSSSSSYVQSSMPMSTTTNSMDRPHRDYEPIWPDPTSSTTPFKIGVSTPHNNMMVEKSRLIPNSNSSISIGKA